MKTTSQKNASLMDYKAYSSLHFRPVGQGLFTHGFVQTGLESKTCVRFNWVYDCGSTRESALNRQIDTYRLFYNEGADIDLLMLSHFDEDHIIGIEALLNNKKKARVIVLPYISVFDSLLLVSQLEGLDIRVARALADPVGYLQELAPEARLVFVLPGGEAPPVNTGIVEIPENDPTSEWSFNSLPFPSEDASHIQKENVGVSAVDSSSPYIFRSIWEFCFYNKPRPDMDASLKDLLRPVVQSLKDTSAKNDRFYVDLIDQVKTIFEQVRGKGGRKYDANEISLVALAGPKILNKAAMLRRQVPWLIPATTPQVDELLWSDYFLKRMPTYGPWINDRCSTLFTGDITLDDATFDDLVRKLSKERMDFVSYFQVPHHGSGLSFLLNKSKGFAPDFSIFSSKQYHVGNDHPSEVVIEKLRKYGPLFVNEFQGLATGAYLP